MKKLVLNRFALGCLVLGAGAVTAVLTAQTPPPAASTPAAPSGPAPTKVGIIQLQVAITSTKDGQAAIADLQKTLIEPRTKDLQGKEQAVRDLQDQLQRGGNTMSDTAKADAQRTIDAKTKSLNRDVEDFQADREEAEGKVLDGLVEKMRVVIDKYARENGYRVLLDVTNGSQSGVLYWANEADVTTQITEAYDKTYPNVGSPAPSKSGATNGTLKAPTPPKAPAPKQSK